MNRMIPLLIAGIAALVSLGSTSYATEVDAPVGAAFVATNAPGRNEVVAFKRAADGTLARVGAFPTGGRGVGIRRVPDLANDTGIDPLVSAGSVVLSPNGQFLFAVNAGSGTFTSFVVSPDCGLTFADTEPSGGALPNSLALHGDLLYVANVGNPAKGVPANVSGLRVGANGHLTPIPDSTRTLSDPAKSQPGHALFSPEGDFLVVTELVADKVTIFRVGDAGILSKPSANPSPGKNPFGARFVGRCLVVGEEQGGDRMGGEGKSSTSSYILGKEGDLKAVSRSLKGGRTGACWESEGLGGRYFYVANGAEGTVTSYRLDAGTGELGLLKATAIERPSKGGIQAGAVDAGSSRDGKYYYQVFGGEGTIAAYRVGEDGGLTPIPGGDVTGLPASAGIQGFAVR